MKNTLALLSLLIFVSLSLGCGGDSPQALEKIMQGELSLTKKNYEEALGSLNSALKAGVSSSKTKESLDKSYFVAYLNLIKGAFMFFSLEMDAFNTLLDNPSPQIEIEAKTNVKTLEVLLEKLEKTKALLDVKEYQEAHKKFCTCIEKFKEANDLVLKIAKQADKNLQPVANLFATATEQYNAFNKFIEDKAKAHSVDTGKIYSE